ncbi:MAG: putative DNA modification/repair radical SAM protein [Clostridiales bacterium]|jgi:putative DNA modification/repair radical SAM protein|nr:putative DNA modification/repair radical SAM protein [Clostridiales bacterium]
MDSLEKLKILTDAAKYDVACTSSGVDRKGTRAGLGSASACGICHTFSADGRCVSLLKILMTNVCVFDCQYCANRRSNDVPRAAFTPREIAELTIRFYKRNYIEGLFLSSAVIKSPDYTMEMLLATLRLVRGEYRFNGYIHVKAIPGADPALVQAAGAEADRMSVNIELPSEESLGTFAPEKTKSSILTPMKLIKNRIIQTKDEITRFRSAPKFVPAGQSTQMIVGATPESDSRIVRLAEGLYSQYKLKRVFYSAFIPVAGANPLLPAVSPPLLREHRLYQADWLLRFYGFTSNELFNRENENLNLNMDPKCHWALNHIERFPVEINRADYLLLLRVPGIGQRSAMKILSARRVGKLDFAHLKKMGVVLKRAKYFITCGGKMMERTPMIPEILEARLSENKIDERYAQIGLFDGENAALAAPDDRRKDAPLLGGLT